MYVLAGLIIGVILSYILLEKEKEKEKGFNRSIVLVGGAFTGAILGHALCEYIFLLAIISAFYVLATKAEEEAAKQKVKFKEELKAELKTEILTELKKEEVQ